MSSLEHFSSELNKLDQSLHSELDQLFEKAENYSLEELPAFTAATATLVSNLILPKLKVLLPRLGFHCYSEESTALLVQLILQHIGVTQWDAPAPTGLESYQPGGLSRFAASNTFDTLSCLIRHYKQKAFSINNGQPSKDKEVERVASVHFLFVMLLEYLESCLSAHSVVTQAPATGNLDHVLDFCLRGFPENQALRSTDYICFSRYVILCWTIDETFLKIISVITAKGAKAELVSEWERMGDEVKQVYRRLCWFLPYSEQERLTQVYCKEDEDEELRKYGLA